MKPRCFRDQVEQIVAWAFTFERFDGRRSTSRDRTAKGKTHPAHPDGHTMPRKEKPPPAKQMVTPYPEDVPDEYLVELFPFFF